MGATRLEADLQPTGWAPPGGLHRVRGGVGWSPLRRGRRPRDGGLHEWGGVEKNVALTRWHPLNGWPPPSAYSAPAFTALQRRAMNGEVSP